MVWSGKMQVRWAGLSCWPKAVLVRTPDGRKARQNAHMPLSTSCHQLHKNKTVCVISTRQCTREIYLYPFQLGDRLRPDDSPIGHFAGQLDVLLIFYPEPHGRLPFRLPSHALSSSASPHRGQRRHPSFLSSDTK